MIHKWVDLLSQSHEKEAANSYELFCELNFFNQFKQSVFLLVAYIVFNIVFVLYLVMD